MKRFLLFLFAMLVMSVAEASPTFKSGTKYRIACKYYGNGEVALGSKHNSTALLYYLTEITTADDGWWYIEKGTNGYTFRNASTNQYIAYSSERISNVQKGLTLASTLDASTCEWEITETVSNEISYLVISNTEETSQWFNLRIDGSYLLGTYEGGGGSSNELFKIYDEKGNDVLDNSGDGGDTDDSSSSYSTGTKGKNGLGEYWERTLLSQPVVYTTDTSNPALYSIINIRTSRYVSVDNSILTEITDSTKRTQFYFVQSGKGVQIYTADGQCVSTDWAKTYEIWDYRTGLSVTSTSSTGNIWSISGQESTTGNNTYKGYALCKLDNLSYSSSGTQQSSYLYWNDYNLDETNHVVGLYDVDGGSVFVFSSSDKRHVQLLQKNGITFPNTEVEPEAPTSFRQALDSLQFDNKEVAYDEGSSSYFFPLSETLRTGGDFLPVLKTVFKSAYTDNGYVVKVNGEAPDGTGTVTFSNVDCATEYPLTLCTADGTMLFESKVKFTFLPIVEINVSSCNGSYYTTGSIRVSDPTNDGFDSTYVAAFKYRGASSQNYSKKSYAVKLRDADGNSIDRKLLGLRSDNNWILDAMYIDRACMRNRVGTDLWNEFSTKPYYSDQEKKLRTGTRGKFVEVLLNGKYFGLYCMTEKMDRKQLKLKKYVDAASSTTGSEEVHGVLYKSTDWSYEVFMGHETDSSVYPYTAPRSIYNYLGQETWHGYEQKYPDATDEAVNWTPLYDAINFVATTQKQSDFDASVKDWFDYPVIRDYYLFIELLFATDNHGKNMFFYVYDTQADENSQKISVAPWDLDGTFGQDYYASISKTSDATQDFDTYIWANEHGQNTLFARLKTSVSIPWATDLKNRYAELRTSSFDPDKLAARFADYAKLFEDSQADTREEAKKHTYHKQLQSEASYAQRWIRNRITALDKKYGYDPSVTSLNEAKADAYFNVRGGNGCIELCAGTPQTVRIYSLSGTLVRQLNVAAGFTPITTLQPGIYVVNGKKVVVE